MKKSLFLVGAMALASCSKEKPAEPVTATPAVDIEISTPTADEEARRSYNAEMQQELGINPLEDSPMIKVLLGMVKRPQASLDARKQAVVALRDQENGYEALTDALSFYEAKPDKSGDDLELIQTIKLERSKIH